jgi:hypothetical protein
MKAKTKRRCARASWTRTEVGIPPQPQSGVDSSFHSNLRGQFVRVVSLEDMSKRTNCRAEPAQIPQQRRTSRKASRDEMEQGRARVKH